MEDENYYIQKFKEIQQKKLNRTLSDKEATYLFTCLKCITAQVFSYMDMEALLTEFNEEEND
jgi:hypothetical protein